MSKNFDLDRFTSDMDKVISEVTSFQQDLVDKGILDRPFGNVIGFDEHGKPISESSSWSTSYNHPIYQSSNDSFLNGCLDLRGCLVPILYVVSWVIMIAILYGIIEFLLNTFPRCGTSISC